MALTIVKGPPGEATEVAAKALTDELPAACAGGKVTVAERPTSQFRLNPTERSRRLRWTILENGKHRGRPTYSPATKHEAQKDAECPQRRALTAT
jgi:hypothetical protein